jgi:hypothetical protein
MYDNALSVSHKYLSMQKHSEYVTAYLMSHDTFIHILVNLHCHCFLEDVGLPFHSVSCQDSTCQLPCEINKWAHGSCPVQEPLEEDCGYVNIKKIKYLIKVMKN